METKTTIFSFSFCLLLAACSVQPAEISRALAAEKKGGLDDYRRAERILLAAEKKHPQDARYSFQLGMLYRRRFNELFRGNIKSFAIEDPNYKPLGPAIRVTDQSGRILGYRVQDLRPAIQPFLRAIRKDPDMDQAYIEAGILYAHSNLMEDAIKMFKRGLARNPDNHMFHHLLGEVYDHLGRSQLALHHYTQSHRLKRDFSATWINKAMVLFELKREKEALYALDRVVAAGDSKRNTARTLRLVMEYHLKRQDLKGAIAWGERYLEKIRESAPLLLNLAKACYYNQQYTKAKKYLNMFLDHHKADAWAFAMLGEIALEEKKTREAARYLRRSLRLKPLPQVLSRLGQLYLDELNSPAQAAELLARAAAQDRENLPLLFNLARAREKAGLSPELRRQTWEQVATLARNRTNRTLLETARSRLAELGKKPPPG